MIVERTCDLLQTRFGKDFERIFIEDVRVGQFLIAVKLSEGTIGIASSLEDDHPFCTKAERDFGEFTPMKIKGRNLRELFEIRKDSKLVFSLRIASINAMSADIISSGKYNVSENADPFDLVDPGEGKTITIVGAFQSYIKKLSETDNRLQVLELNENALRPEQKKYYIPASEYRSAISKSDIVIITGQTLVNNTLDNLLDALNDGTTVIVTGPSGSMLPDALFEKGVTIIGATRLTKPGLVFDLVSQAGLAYHMFEYCAQKISIRKA